VTGSVLLTIAGIGLAVVGLARNDCSTELQACAARVDAGEVSLHHQIHDNVSLIIFLALIAASLVLARAFGRDDRWRPLRTYCIVTGVLGFALLVLYVIEPAPAWNGLVQRVFVSVLFVWIAVVGFWLSRVNLSLANAGLRERPPR
jgi:heme/copper-type cytochrome/quinol oxidase subunit 3